MRDWPTTLLLLGIPGVLSVVLYLLPLSRRVRRRTAALGVMALMVVLLLSPLGERLGIGRALVELSQLDAFFVGLWGIAGIAVALLGGEAPYGENFASVVLLTLGATIGIALAQSILVAAIFLQLANVATALIIPRRPRLAPSIATALRYLVLNFAGGVALIVGLILADILRLSPENTYLLRITAVFLAVGLGIRIASIPFQAWLVETSENALPLASALVISMVNVSGLFLVIRVIASYPQLLTDPRVNLVLTLAASLSAGLGALSALGQNSLRRFLAYSVSYDVGFILYGISSATDAGWLGAIWSALHHGLALLLLFSAASSLSSDGDTSLSQLTGVARRLPATAAAIIVGCWSILGAPPTAGFVGRWPIYLAAAKSPPLLALLLTSSGLMLLACLRMFRPLFAATSRNQESAPEPVSRSAILILLTTLLLAVGLWPTSLVRLILRASVGLPFFGGS